jgi:hypothetical protein
MDPGILCELHFRDPALQNISRSSLTVAPRSSPPHALPIFLIAMGASAEAFSDVDTLTAAKPQVPASDHSLYCREGTEILFFLPNPGVLPPAKSNFG